MVNRTPAASFRLNSTKLPCVDTGAFSSSLTNIYIRRLLPLHPLLGPLSLVTVDHGDKYRNVLRLNFHGKKAVCDEEQRVNGFC